MGLLAVGTPLQWEDSLQYLEKVKYNGVTQLLKIMKESDKVKNKPFLWGDELEYILIDNKNNKLTVNNDDILIELNTELESECKKNDLVYHPEYGSYMIEATPYFPYSHKDIESYVSPEANMILRKKFINEKYMYQRDLYLLQMTNYPRLGCKNFIGDYDCSGEYISPAKKNIFSQSLFLPDEITNKHPRFPTLTGNIRKRRNRKVNLQIPMFKDIKTPSFDDTVYDREWFDMDVKFIKEDPTAQGASDDLKSYKLRPNHIYIDAMGFGMGACCLQTTYQAPDLENARYLYDSLMNFTSVLLSISANSPFWKGFVSDWDCRWEVISSMVDCRTGFEENTNIHDNNYGYNLSADNTGLLSSPMKRIKKSRYSKVDVYLGCNKIPKDLSQLNDVEVVLNEEVFDRVTKELNGDENLARHFAHLFIRDPIVIFEENVDDVDDNMDHFENINSTNWQSLRFKIPHKISEGDAPEPGFRVEFRPLEIQLTDFANAAFSFLLNIIVQFMLSPKTNINFYIEMSKVWQNFDQSIERNSILKDKFHWVEKFKTFDECPSVVNKTCKMSIDQIMHNEDSGILTTLVNQQLRALNFIAENETWEDLRKDKDNTKERLYYYLRIISDRSKGVLPTEAKWQRDYVLSHPEYAKDSKVTELISSDLINLTKKVYSYSPESDEEKKWYFKLFGEEIGEYLINHKL
ncbi:hypothetical protein ACO0SA_002906 [Hanseniaspora valbyensis]